MALLSVAISCVALVAAEDSGFKVHTSRNTYLGWGSEELDGNKMWSDRSSEDCMNLCMATDDCDCAVFVDKDSWSYKEGDCFLRGQCDPSKFQTAEGFEVFEKTNSTDDRKAKAKAALEDKWDQVDADRLASIKKEMSHPFYTSYINQNTFHPDHGSDDLPGNYLWHPTTPNTCSRICTALPNCNCTVYVHVDHWEFRAGDCLLRANCTPEHFQQGVGGFEVLMRQEDKVDEALIHSARVWAADYLGTINTCASGEHGCEDPAKTDGKRAKHVIAKLDLLLDQEKPISSTTQILIACGIILTAIVVLIVAFMVYDKKVAPAGQEPQHQPLTSTP